MSLQASIAGTRGGCLHASERVCCMRRLAWLGEADGSPFVPCRSDDKHGCTKIGLRRSGSFGGVRTRIGFIYEVEPVCTPCCDQMICTTPVEGIIWKNTVRRSGNCVLNILRDMFSASISSAGSYLASLSLSQPRRNIAFLPMLHE